MKMIYKIIYKRRQQLNYSQSFVGMKLDLSQKQYGRIESGEAKLKLNDFIKLCKILDLHPCDVLKEANLVSDCQECKKSESDLISN